MSKKPRKKYNPMSIALKMAKSFSKRFAIVWAGTLTAQVVSIGTSKPVQLSKSEAYAITDTPHKWKVYLCVMCRDNFGKDYIQTQELVFTNEYYSSEVSDIVTDKLNDFYRTCNQNHRVNVGWIATTSEKDLSDRALAEMMTDIGAWSFLALWETKENADVEELRLA